jgi:hypothetical protein
MLFRSWEAQQPESWNDEMMAAFGLQNLDDDKLTEDERDASKSSGEDGGERPAKKIRRTRNRKWVESLHWMIWN